MRISVTVLLDALVVIAFVAIGRASHDEAGSVVGFVGTLWPFAAGLAVGVLLRPFARVRLPAGVLTWVATVVVGMLLRVVSGQGIAATFVAVAAAFLGLAFLGWRGVALAVRRPGRARS